MKKDLSQWSLVIVGRWNRAILSAQWLAKEVLGEEEIGIMFPVVGVGPPIFYTKDLNLRIVVSSESVTFVPLKDSREVLTRIEKAATHILKTLPHTPILAFGENFHYTVDGCPDELTRLLNLEDADRLGLHGKIGGVSLKRTVNLEACELNLTLSRDGACRIELNYHYAATPESATADAMAKRMEGTYVANRGHGLKLLEAVYGLTLEEDTSYDNEPT